MRLFFKALYAADPEVRKFVLDHLLAISVGNANQSTLLEIERWLKEDFTDEELEQVIAEYTPRLQAYTGRATDFEVLVALIDQAPPGSDLLYQFATDVCEGDGTGALSHEFIAEVRRRSQSR